MNVVADDSMAPQLLAKQCAVQDVQGENERFSVFGTLLQIGFDDNVIPGLAFCDTRDNSLREIILLADVKSLLFRQARLEIRFSRYIYKNRFGKDSLCYEFGHGLLVDNGVVIKDMQCNAASVSHAYRRRC
ncbi:hypothetical protein SDC9_183675 [bioreactor metagenome]|uniref:Uncharacterized protein n=1 Tax=bioreactor metagenome TaxID=1076179 RepID=A0A645HAW6_9ZZZZ